MGIEVAIITAMAGSVYGGVSAQQSGKAQEKFARKQAKLVIAESREEAERLQGEFDQFNAMQALSFLSSGLNLLGTPSAVRLSNEVRQAQEIQSVLDAGVAQSDFLKSQGVTAKREGRAKLIGGFTQAIGFGAAAVQAGAFTPSTVQTTSSGPVTAAQESAATRLRF